MERSSLPPIDRQPQQSAGLHIPAPNFNRVPQDLLTLPLPLGSSCRYTSWTTHSEANSGISFMDSIWDSEEDDSTSGHTMPSMSRCSTNADLLHSSGAEPLPDTEHLSLPPMRRGTKTSGGGPPVAQRAWEREREREKQRDRECRSQHGPPVRKGGRDSALVMKMEQPSAVDIRSMAPKGVSCRYTSWSVQDRGQPHFMKDPQAYGPGAPLTAMPLAVDKNGLSDPFSWKELEKSCRHLDDMSVKISTIDLSCVEDSPGTPSLVMYNVHVELSQRPTTQESFREPLEMALSGPPSQSARPLFPSLSKIGRRSRSDSHVGMSSSSMRLNGQSRKLSSVVQLWKSRYGNLFQKAPAKPAYQ